MNILILQKRQRGVLIVKTSLFLRFVIMFVNTVSSGCLLGWVFEYTMFHQLNLAKALVRPLCIRYSQLVTTFMSNTVSLFSPNLLLLTLKFRKMLTLELYNVFLKTTKLKIRNLPVSTFLSSVLREAFILFAFNLDSTWESAVDATEEALLY